MVVGMSCTPAVFINGRKIAGAYPFETFKKIADHYLDYRKKFSVWGSSQTMKPTYVGK